MTFTLFGDIKRIVRAQRLETESVTTIFGDVKLDLTKAELAPGDHTLRLITAFGDIKLRLPEHIGVEVDAVILFGEVEVETLSSGEEEKPGASWVSENYSSADVRVRLHVLSLFGDIDVVRAPSAVEPAPRAAQLPDNNVFEPTVSYEGQTTKLPRD